MNIKLKGTMAPSFNIDLIALGGDPAKMPFGSGAGTTRDLDGNNRQDALVLDNQGKRGFS